MNEWRIFKYDDREAHNFWLDLGDFETEHSWLNDSEIQRLGEEWSVGSYMLLPPLGAYYSRIELTIAARQAFYTVVDEPEEPVEVPAGIEEGSSLEAVLDPRD